MNLDEEKIELAFKRWAFDHGLPTIRAMSGDKTYWHAETEAAWRAFDAGYRLGKEDKQ